MTDNLEEFYQLLQLDKDFPLDELKDHYFVPARATLNSNRSKKTIQIYSFEFFYSLRIKA